MQLSLEDILRKASASGAQAEVLFVRSRSVELSWEKMSQYGMTYVEEGCGLRVIKDGRVGFAYSNRCTEELVNMALSSMEASQPDLANALPGPEPVSPLEDSYDSSLEEPWGLLRDLMEAVLSYSGRGLNIISARAWGGTATVTVKNTEGVDVSSTTSFVGAAATGNYMSESYVGPEVYEYGDSRTARGVSVDPFMKELLRKVELTRSRNPLKQVDRPVALTAKAVSELLFPLLNHAVSLENVYRGRSPLRPGDALGSRVTAVDNPRLPGGAWSRAFDGEGLPTKEVTLIDSGTFRTPLSNTFWARKAGGVNTHSSWRTFMTLPSISMSYLVLDAPSAGDLGDAVFIDQVQGVHTSNFDTGEFAVSAALAWDSDGGLREFVLSGDLRSLLGGVIGMAPDRSRFGRVVSGTLLVRGLRLSP